MNEPWIRLMTLRTPHTSEKPIAMHAYRQPNTKALTRIWATHTFDTL